MRSALFLLATMFTTEIFLAIGSTLPVFLSQKIDGPSPHWFGPFSEGSAVFDVNKDGALDITAGANWYERPEFIRHPLREAIVHGAEFVNNCGEYAYDVNGDGWTLSPKRRGRKKVSLTLPSPFWERGQGEGSKLILETRSTSTSEFGLLRRS